MYFLPKLVRMMRIELTEWGATIPIPLPDILISVGSIALSIRLSSLSASEIMGVQPNALSPLYYHNLLTMFSMLPT